MVCDGFPAPMTHDGVRGDGGFMSIGTAITLANHHNMLKALMNNPLSNYRKPSLKPS